MTASVTVPGGETVRVIALDVALIEISRFTSSIEVHERGRAFVLTEDGRVVGLPRGPRSVSDELIRDSLLKRPEEVGTRLAIDASRALLTAGGPGPDPVRFTSEGQAWWGQSRAFTLPGSERRLLAGVVIAEADLLGEIGTRRLLMGLLVLLFLGVATWRAVGLARRYSRPVEELVAESERIGRGDLEPGEPVVSRVEEVRQLSAAHDRMRVGLQKLLRVERDLQIARDIQMRTFPDKLPELPGYELAAYSEPADETGGDSYDVIGYRAAEAEGRNALTQEEAERVVFMLADATGHGIGPALSVTQVRAMLRIAVRMARGPVEILRLLNEQLCADLSSSRFITAWLAALDPRRHTLLTFSAGQAPLLLHRAASDRCEVFDSDTIPLGMFGGMKVPEKEPLVLEPGDLYAAISDGIFEAADPAGEEFGTERVVELLRAHREAPLAELLDSLRREVEEFTEGAPPSDDRTVILIRRGQCG